MLTLDDILKETVSTRWGEFSGKKVIIQANGPAIFFQELRIRQGYKHHLPGRSGDKSFLPSEVKPLQALAKNSGFQKGFSCGYGIISNYNT